MSHKSDREIIANTKNLSRYFTEIRQVAWVLLVTTVILGVYGYVKMPKRKDPFIKIRSAVAVCVWPGAPPDKIEELISRRIEEKASQSTDVEKIEATSRSNVSVVTITLREDLPVPDVPKAFDDIDLRLRSINDLPQGASPIDFQKDFGDTAALMLTVASPRAREVEIALRAQAVASALAKAREGKADRRAAVVLNFPGSQNPDPMRRVIGLFSVFAQQGGARDVAMIEGAGFIGLDGVVTGDEDGWRQLVGRFLAEKVRATRLHPDVWRPVYLTEPSQAVARITEIAGDAYSYRELDDFTDAIVKRLRRVPSVSRVVRAGVLGERVYLNYSQERFAALGVGQDQLKDAIGARNIQVPGGMLEADGRNLTIDPSGGYKDEHEIEGTLLATSASGSPLYVRDVAEVLRDYESPPSYVNHYTWRDAAGAFHTNRAITLSVQMRDAEQIGKFSTEVNAALAEVAQTVPEDLIIARTSDQPRQVEDKISLFMMTLYEAIAIIVVVGLFGFREWRAALVLALSIPITLAMTFVFMTMLGIDVQQMSIAALILALGLLVDDPVVASDAIKDELDHGQNRRIAAWLGPTKLARAILFATITNIVAYLPFLLIKGDVGRFVYSLPIVLTCSLVASRIVSMTFIPLLGYAILRRTQRARPADPNAGMMGAYRRLVAWSIDHRYKVLLLSTIVLAGGGFAGSRLRSSFFPKDLSYLSYVDIYLPEDASISSTTDAATEADRVVREVAEEYGRERVKAGEEPRDVLRSITTFIGGGAPRFWYSLAPQQRQLNYAQLVVEVTDDRDTAELIDPLQRALSEKVPGARIDVRQLENGKPVPSPVELRFSGNDIPTLRGLSEKAQSILRGVDIADRVRDDWGVNSFRVNLEIDPVRANLAGVTNLDVAASSAGGFSGVPLSYLRDGNKLIPIVARLRPEERGSLGDIRDLYVLSARGARKVPLGQVSKVVFSFASEKIQRRNQIRTISVAAFPTAGHLPSEVMRKIRGRLPELQAMLPPGYAMEIGGSEENVKKVAGESAIVALVSVLAILMTLVIQFRHAVKPLIVFAAIPYGIAGALLAIVIMGTPFGFTAIVGVISLIGVIVSHIIVLFDYIEEAQERGETLRKALLDAGTKRLRPVMITVGATVLGLVPLAIHGGPLWEPLCYAQIGGLTLATGITLLLVPVLYAIFVVDLKWVRWGEPAVAYDDGSSTEVMRRPAGVGGAATGPGGTLVIVNPLGPRPAPAPRPHDSSHTAVMDNRPKAPAAASAWDAAETDVAQSPLKGGAFADRDGKLPSSRPAGPPARADSAKPPGRDSN